VQTIKQGDQIGGIFAVGLDCLHWAAFSSTEVSQIFGLNFFLGKVLCLNFAKNVLGYILGDFFTNSSGHPAVQLHNCSHLYLAYL
jgi:hypothetical protein